MKTVKKVAMVPVYIFWFCMFWLVVGCIFGTISWAIQWVVYHIEYFILPGIVVGLLVWASRKAKV